MRTKTYQRTDRETDRAYNLFLQYLNLGPSRTLNALAEQTQVDLEAIKRYNSKHDWGRRASDYDEELLEGIVESRATMIADNQITVMQDGLTDYLDLLDKWRATLNDPETALTPRNLNMLMNVRMKIDDLGRRAVQLPTHYTMESITQRQEPETITLAWQSRPTIPGVVVQSIPATEAPSKAEEED